ncbi:alpha/beta hydrolase [uncultured Actinomyces sp.]|uniref:alpha/beta hydrolase n=1 Tax=uncultured Actinomyces sp. TaxID=249061 RepID=UPI0028ED9934|nr:alpha/beta hydrolase [uncultured Actinomyces sp.]
MTQAQEVLRGLTKKHTRLVNEVSELMMATVEATDGVGDVQTLVLECTQYAQTHPELTLNADGSVDYPKRDVTMGDLTDSRGPSGDACHAALTERDANELKSLVTKALARAVDVDEAYGKRLDALTNGTYTCVETSTTHSPGLPNQPQAGWSPTQVAFWWASLTQAEKQAIITEHPEWIGNLDGIDMASRSQANLNRLSVELAAAQAEYNKFVKDRDELLRKNIDQKYPEEEQMEKAKNKLDDLQKIQDNLTAHPDRSLLVLDISGPKRVRAAVAIGDVDTADHVATFVPGMGTNPADKLDEYTGNVQRLKKRMEVYGKNDTSATIAWLGYDAPPGFLEPGWGDVAEVDLARDGAERLSSFVEGINASRAVSGASEPHQTVLGHSYGSTTAGFAADHVRAGVIDDLVLFGSPGAGVHDVREYNLPPGHVYASAVDSHDIVQGMGTDEDFGVDPMDLDGVTHISGDVPEPDGCGWMFSPTGRHGTYMNEGSEALEDMARVAVGVYR